MGVDCLPQGGGLQPGILANRRNLAAGAIIILLLVVIGAFVLYHKRMAAAAGVVLLVGGLAVGYAVLSYGKIMARAQEPTETRGFGDAAAVLPARTPTAGGASNPEAFAEDLASTAFRQSDIDEMLTILASGEKAHNSDNETVREHVIHCLHQMVRLAHLAAGGGKFRAAQWGLNMGRAQELLKSAGGIEAWWRAFKDIINDEDWPLLKSKSETYIRLLQLDQPDTEFINTP